MNYASRNVKAAPAISLAEEADFSLGPLRICPALREISVANRTETVEPRVMQVLVVLARAASRVVSREQLVDRCWGGRLVGDDAVNNAIVKVRALAGLSLEPAFEIETIPRVGYRLRPRQRDAVHAALSVSPWHSKSWGRIGLAVAGIVIAAGLVAALYFDPRREPERVVEASVAVLPFVNMSGDPKQEYFSDGFSEELVNDLSNNRNLRVASRTSSFAFKSRNQDIEAIARALRVHAIVEGSVRESGDRVRITAQLINGNDGYHLWSEAYDRNLTDIISVQSELARAIAVALTHHLLPPRDALRPKINPAIYRLFLEGIHQFEVGPPQGWRRASAIFRQVTLEAPDFADGFAWLARVAENLAINYDAEPASDYVIVSAAAQRALALDSRNTMARAFRAIAEMDVWDWHAAALDLQILRRQNPDSYFSIGGAFNYYLLLGFPDRAYAEWRRLYALDPNAYDDSYFTLIALDVSHHFPEEIELARQQLLHRPRDTARRSKLCGAYAAAGEIVQARGVSERIRSLQGNSDSESDFQDCKLNIDFASGNRSDALGLLQIYESGFPDKQARACDIAVGFVELGDFDKASEWFERAYERRELSFFQKLHFGSREPAFLRYRRTPGYETLSEKPLFRKWQAEYDRIAAALAAHRDPLSLQ